MQDFLTHQISIAYIAVRKETAGFGLWFAYPHRTLHQNAILTQFTLMQAPLTGLLSVIWTSDASSCRPSANDIGERVHAILRGAHTHVNRTSTSAPSKTSSQTPFPVWARSCWCSLVAFSLARRGRYGQHSGRRQHFDPGYAKIAACQGSVW